MKSHGAACGAFELHKCCNRLFGAFFEWCGADGNSLAENKVIVNLTKAFPPFGLLPCQGISRPAVILVIQPRVNKMSSNNPKRPRQDSAELILPIPETRRASKRRVTESIAVQNPPVVDPALRHFSSPKTAFTRTQHPLLASVGQPVRYHVPIQQQPYQQHLVHHQQPYQQQLVHQHVYEAPPPPQQAPVQIPATTDDLRADDYPLEDVNLGFPGNLTPNEMARRKAAFREEREFQKKYPPMLPKSALDDLSPKEVLEDFHQIPENCTEELRVWIEERNNQLAAAHLKLDRARNNDAAKKSRATRVEALDNAKMMLYQKTAECAWFRAKIISMGGDTSGWYRLPQKVKDNMASKVAQRVKTTDAIRAQEKKDEDSKKRSMRNHERNRRKREIMKQYKEAEKARMAMTARNCRSSGSTPELEAAQLDG